MSGLPFDPAWLWLIGGVLLLIAELIAPGFSLIFIGAAGIATGLLSLAIGLPVVLQLATFAVLAFVAARTRRLGPAAPHGYRVPWSRVRALGRKKIRLDLDAAATPLWSLERWLADRVIARLPGGRR